MPDLGKVVDPIHPNLAEVVVCITLPDDPPTARHLMAPGQPLSASRVLFSPPICVYPPPIARPLPAHRQACPPTHHLGSLTLQRSLHFLTYIAPRLIITTILL